MIEVRISDVRHFTFCQRVVWYRLVRGEAGRETAKMALGRRAEAALDELEKRRQMRQYGLEGAVRRFDVSLRSETLGVHGVCDLVLDVAGGERPAAFPVEVKTTRGGVGQHHVLQLAGYAMLLEEAGAATVDRAFVLLLPDDRVEQVSIGPAEREAFVKAVEQIRAMVETERFPEPTRHRSFCPDCEFVNFCGDVL
jgi:CRISPR-associated exonuclease Cas4